VLQSAHTYTFSSTTLINAMARAGLTARSLIPCGVHFAVLFQVDPGAVAPQAPNGAEYARVAAIVRRYERRERIKGWLKRAGLFSIAQRAIALVR